MRKFLIVVVAVLAFATTAFANEQFKIGSVDFQRALNESEFGTKTRTELESIIRSRQGAIDEDMQKLDNMRKDLEAQAAVISESAFRQRVEEIEKFERDLERRVNDSNEELGKLQRRKEYEILNELDALVTEIAKQEGYDLILPIDVIIYSADGVDITDKVIEMYDESKKAPAKDAGAGE